MNKLLKKLGPKDLPLMYPLISILRNPKSVDLNKNYKYLCYVRYASITLGFNIIVLVKHIAIIRLYVLGYWRKKKLRTNYP